MRIPRLEAEWIADGGVLTPIPMGFHDVVLDAPLFVLFANVAFAVA
jgi:hypothetical protein